MQTSIINIKINNRIDTLPDSARTSARRQENRRDRRRASQFIQEDMEDQALPEVWANEEVA